MLFYTFSQQAGEGRYSLLWPILPLLLLEEILDFGIQHHLFLEDVSAGLGLTLHFDALGPSTTLSFLE